MASQKILDAKKAQVAELSDKMKNSTAGVVVTYTGITVDQDTKLRNELRKAGVVYKVYKNSLASRAAVDAGYSKLSDYLVGMTAIAISPNDPVVAAKILKDYASKIDGFNIQGGYVDKEVLDAKGVNALAEIPSKETLIARIMGSVMGPLYNLAYGLQAIVDKGQVA